MRRPAFHLVVVFAVFLLCGLFATTADAQVWRSMGPPGGDVRALAASPSDPSLLYLGTADGHVFSSRDGGTRWELIGRVGSRRDSVITVLLVDSRNPKLLLASAWTQDPTAGGGVYRSADGGKSWTTTGLAGKAVRALAQAPSNPDILIAGTLDGAYRSRDDAQTWERISPEGHEEIRNLDSIAIDPADPDVIYIGTYHLPWKTTNGGREWFPIHTGMIDDSDVMSIVLDRTNPRRIYASACSGIYRSDNGGVLWRKIQGIPFSARRTYVIRQDPHQPRTVFAGTSEGLWKTLDGGDTWRLTSPRDWVINTLVLNAGKSGRLVIGTERLGIVASEDGGATFRAANDGFHHRQIISLALDQHHPGRILAVLANAPEPILATEDGGANWAPLGPGLPREGVRRLFASPEGWWATLERGGLLRYDAKKSAWVRAGVVVGEAALMPTPAERQKPPRPRKMPAASVSPRPLVLEVTDLAFSRDIWFAATTEGLLASRDTGATWDVFPFAPLNLAVASVRASLDGSRIWVVSLRGMVFSRDGGKTWSWHDLPFDSGGALRLEAADDSTLVAIARKGLYVSRDGGKNWSRLANGLPQAVALQDLALIGDVFLASMQTGGLYLSTDRGLSWARVEGPHAEGFFPVVIAAEGARAIFAASATEGLFAVEFTGKGRIAAGQESNR